MSESINPLGTGWQPSAGDAPNPPADAPAPATQSDNAAPAVASPKPAETLIPGSAPGTTEVDSGADPDAPPAGEKPTPGRNWAGRKIDTLTRQLEEANRERARATGFAEEMFRRLGPTPGQPASTTQAPAAPRREDFTDIEAYFEAKATFTAQKTARELFEGMQRGTQEQQRVANEQAQARQMAETFQSKIAESAKAYPDFKKIVLEDGAHVPIGNAAMGLAQAGNPAGVMIYLAQHPDVAEKIATMHPVFAALEVGKIDASLGRPQVSNAPPPGTLIGSRPSASGAAPPENHSSAQYMAWAAKNMK